MRRWKCRIAMHIAVYRAQRNGETPGLGARSLLERHRLEWKRAPNGPPQDSKAANFRGRAKEGEVILQGDLVSSIQVGDRRLGSANVGMRGGAMGRGAPHQKKSE